MVRYSGSAYSGIQRGFCLLILFLTLFAFRPNASAGTGQLVPNPASNDFGNVPVGTSQTKSVTLTNSGGPKITISQVSLSGTGFVLSGLNYPITLAGGQSVACTITFTPTSTVTDSGSVSIVVTTQSSGGKHTNSPSSSTSTTVTVTMSGTGVSSGQLVASPTTSISFGNVQVGSTQTVTETLTN
jgi:hypothetical protein